MLKPGLETGLVLSPVNYPLSLQGALISPKPGQWGFFGVFSVIIAQITGDWNSENCSNLIYIWLKVSTSQHSKGALPSSLQSTQRFIISIRLLGYRFQRFNLTQKPTITLMNTCTL